MEIPTYIDGHGNLRQDWKACLVLQTCPITNGLPTKMLMNTFYRLCHASLGDGKNSYCSQICQGRIRPPELTFIALLTGKEVTS